jgi:hypothetical protein
VKDPEGDIYFLNELRTDRYGKKFRLGIRIGLLYEHD